jgi:hypothetical protein
MIPYISSNLPIIVIASKLMQMVKASVDDLSSIELRWLWVRAPLLYIFSGPYEL